jgi:multiple sugar transport system permease protein
VSYLAERTKRKATVPSPRTRRGEMLESRVLGYFMAMPTILVLVLIIIGPLVYSAVLSTYSWRLTELNQPKTFVFLDNYLEIARDPVFWTATLNTFMFVIGTVSVELVLGFLIALLLNEIGLGRRIATSIILLPMIITPVIVALIWRYMYDPQFGIINYAIQQLGYPGEIGFLSRANLALPSLMLVDIWQMTPFVVLVLHAGLLTVSTEAVEAARVDGAGYWQVVRHVIIPFLVPLIVLVLLLRTMDTYRVFDTIYVLTKGGPGLATETVGIYTYRSAFTFFRMGYGMALAIVTLLIIVVISLLYVRLQRRVQ